MAKCEACGNDYDKAFQVIMKGNTYTFDSFGALSMCSRRTATTAAFISSGTGSRRRARSSAAIIVPRSKASPACAIALGLAA